MYWFVRGKTTTRKQTKERDNDREKRERHTHPHTPLLEAAVLIKSHDHVETDLSSRTEISGFVHQIEKLKFLGIS